MPGGVAGATASLPSNQSPTRLIQGTPGGIGIAREGPTAGAELFSLYLHSRYLWEDEVRKPSA